MRRCVILFVTCFTSLAFLAGVDAPAALAAGESVRGTLTVAGAPVAGVRISVSTDDGAPVGNTVSDAEGQWQVPVPAAATYRVQLDESTLPAAVVLTNHRPSITPVVAAGQARNVLFPLGQASAPPGQTPAASAAVRDQPGAATQLPGVPGGVPVTAIVVTLSVLVVAAAIGFFALRSASGRRSRQAADAAMWQRAFATWFDTVQRIRPPGLQTPTGELLQDAGSPYALLGQRVADDPAYYAAARHYGQQEAARLSRQARLASDQDAVSRAQFWDAVARRL